ncbi:MAG: SSU ribosomal protein S16p, partial [uncultured Acetobacteraceae bacterium]
GPQDPPRPRRRQEAPLLPHRGGRQPLAARRPLHREARLLQPDAAVRARGPRAPARRADQALDGPRRARHRPRGEVPRQGRARADAGVPRAAEEVRAEEEGAGARRRGRRFGGL